MKQFFYLYLSQRAIFTLRLHHDTHARTHAHTHAYRHRQTGRQAGRQADRQADRQTEIDRDRDRDTERDRGGVGVETSRQTAREQVLIAVVTSAKAPTHTHIIVRHHNYVSKHYSSKRTTYAPHGSMYVYMCYFHGCTLMYTVRLRHFDDINAKLFVYNHA